ncbi:hypothetical protein AB0F17_27190 [Nonomuraea sp. NPDC026600]|uniref:hypothetical protein n=1 Tax=Nonomuraea sp. NPDC026600 TaxID=3155363 RepID=UPI0033F949C9
MFLFDDACVQDLANDLGGHHEEASWIESPDAVTHTPAWGAPAPQSNMLFRINFLRKIALTAASVRIDGPLLRWPEGGPGSNGGKSNEVASDLR